MVNTRRIRQSQGTEGKADDFFHNDLILQTKSMPVHCKYYQRTVTIGAMRRKEAMAEEAIVQRDIRRRRSVLGGYRERPV